MRVIIILLSLLTYSSYAQETLMNVEGLIHVETQDNNVKVVADRLVAVLKARGLKLFARVNHAQGAAGAGLTLRPTELVLFGNPKVGTPLMQCNQTTAIDLPQKALIWQAEDEKVRISYNDPTYLAQRHGISQACAEPLAKVAQALEGLATAAAEPQSTPEIENTAATYSASEGMLHIPLVEVEDTLGGVIRYQVDMHQVAADTPIAPQALLFLVTRAVALPE